MYNTCKMRKKEWLETLEFVQDQFRYVIPFQKFTNSNKLLFEL